MIGVLHRYGARARSIGEETRYGPDRARVSRSRPSYVASAHCHIRSWAGACLRLHQNASSGGIDHKRRGFPVDTPASRAGVSHGWSRECGLSWPAVLSSMRAVRAGGGRDRATGAVWPRLGAPGRHAHQVPLAPKAPLRAGSVLCSDREAPLAHLPHSIPPQPSPSLLPAFSQPSPRHHV